MAGGDSVGKGGELSLAKQAIFFFYISVLCDNDNDRGSLLCEYA